MAEHELVRLTVENEWIPTNLHRTFLNESNQNYAGLQREIQHRKDDMNHKRKLLTELNNLSKNVKPKDSCKTFAELPKRVQQKLPEILDIFETYVNSLIYLLHKTEYNEVLLHQDCPNSGIDKPEVLKKPYTAAICRLLESCWDDKNKQWHILTPLFLYHAFSQNTQIIIWNGRDKLVEKINIPKTASSVEKMASTPGYRAGINLVLYQKLLNQFGVSDETICLLGRTKKNCASTYTDEAILHRINHSGCALYDEEAQALEDAIPHTPAKQDWCSFARSGKDWNHFGFYLTTGYSNLYHHHESNDIIYLSASELEGKKKAKALEPEESSNERKYPIYQYQYNFREPVGTLEWLIEHHIRNCIPNRPQDLTPTTPNAYRTDTLHPQYESLANFLLQDMYLPPIQRISRTIKHILSEHPSYLDTFRMYLRYPWASGLSYELEKIIERHQLKELILRYSDYSLSTRSYSVDDSLHAILEYIIRAQLIEELQCQLCPLVLGCIDKKLFAYPPHKRKPRKSTNKKPDKSISTASADEQNI